MGHPLRLPHLILFEQFFSHLCAMAVIILELPGFPGLRPGLIESAFQAGIEAWKADGSVAQGEALRTLGTALGFPNGHSRSRIK